MGKPTVHSCPQHALFRTLPHWKTQTVPISKTRGLSPCLQKQGALRWLCPAQPLPMQDHSHWWTGKKWVGTITDMPHIFWRGQLGHSLKWAPTNRGSSSFNVLSFCFFIAVHGVLKARILKWFAIPFSSGPCFVRTLHHDPSILGGPTQHGS